MIDFEKARIAAATAVHERILKGDGTARTLSDIAISIYNAELTDQTEAEARTARGDAWAAARGDAVAAAREALDRMVERYKPATMSWGLASSPIDEWRDANARDMAKQRERSIRAHKRIDTIEQRLDMHSVRLADISALAQRLARVEDTLAEMRGRLDKVIAPSRPTPTDDHDLNRADGEGMIDRRDTAEPCYAAVDPRLALVGDHVRLNRAVSSIGYAIADGWHTITQINEQWVRIKTGLVEGDTGWVARGFIREARRG